AATTRGGATEADGSPLTTVPDKTSRKLVRDDSLSARHNDHKGGVTVADRMGALQTPCQLAAHSSIGMGLRIGREAAVAGGLEARVEGAGGVDGAHGSDGATV